MIFLFLLLPLVNGALLSLQQVMNAALAVRIGNMKSSVVSHFIGALFAGFLLMMGVKTGHIQISGIPVIYFLGGCLGVCTVAMGNYAIPRIGVVMLALLFLSSQLMTSSLIDHFGLLGVKTIPFTISHGLGLLLLIVGAILGFVKEEAQLEQEAIPSSEV